MPPEWIVWLAGLLAPGVGAMWLFATKVWFPEQAKIREHERQIAAERAAAQQREEARDHQHEREQIEARNAAEQSEQMAVWAQMTQLQSQTLRQNELLLEYIINDFKGGQDGIKDEIKQLMYESRAVQAKMTILVSVISEMYDKKTATKDEILN